MCIRDRGAELWRQVHGGAKENKYFNRRRAALEEGARAARFGVASGILPDVEGGIPAAWKKSWPHRRPTNTPQRYVLREVSSAGLQARLYGRQDACRYDPRLRNYKCCL